MKNVLKTTLIFLLTIFLCCSSVDVAYAQKSGSKPKKSLVTELMAKKVAYWVNYPNSDLLTYFYDANDIKSIREGDKILMNINQHYDCVERFIVKMIKMCGVDSGWLVFKDMGFTPQEYDIAEEIYNQYVKQDSKKENNNITNTAANKLAIDEELLNKRYDNDNTKLKGFQAAVIKRLKDWDAVRLTDEEYLSSHSSIDHPLAYELDKDGVIKVIVPDNVTNDFMLAKVIDCIKKYYNVEKPAMLKLDGSNESHNVNSFGAIHVAENSSNNFAYSFHLQLKRDNQNKWTIKNGELIKGILASRYNDVDGSIYHYLTLSVSSDESLNRLKMNKTEYDAFFQWHTISILIGNDMKSQFTIKLPDRFIFRKHSNDNHCIKE